MTTDGTFYIPDEASLQATYKYFALFSKNKQLLNEQMRLEAILNQQESRKKLEASFKPSICSKSQILARKSRSQVLRKQGLTKEMCASL